MPETSYHTVCGRAAARLSATLEGLGWGPVLYKKLPRWQEGDPLPCTVVAPAVESVGFEEFAFGSTVLWSYPVAVVHYQAAESIADQDGIGRLLGRMKDAMLGLYQFEPTLALDLPDVFDIELVPGVAVEATDGGGPFAFDANGFVVVYQVLGGRLT